MIPKVFISHASEDKERFVINFAKKLRSSGIDAWLDFWEMLPGDSLVDKIFDEGIKNADAFVIVLSNYSINKKWVKEELNSAFVKKVDKSTKLIPIIIDSDIDVPEALHSTIWMNISDLNNYEDEFERIRNSIFGVYSKPEIGTPPKYVNANTILISGLNRTDTLLFKILCEIALDKGHGNISISEIYPIAEKKYNISKELVDESLEVLDRKYYFKSLKTNRGIANVTLTVSGFNSYAEQFIESFNESINKICMYLLNNKINISAREITESTNMNSYLVKHILELLTFRSFIESLKTSGGGVLVTKIYPELRRLYDS